MRSNQSSTPSLSLALTSFKPHNGEITNHQNTSDNEYYSPTSPSSPTSLLSSSTTVTSTSYTFSSSPNSPSLSAVQPQHVRSPRLISEKLKISHNQSTESKSSTVTATVLRRRPSNIDILLQQEHTRASINEIERKGLDLLEPRPVDLEPIGPVGINARGVQLQPIVTRDRLPTQSPINNHGIDNENDGGHGDDRNQIDGAAQAEGMNTHSQPRFVMGGIFEVMEGRG
ncbi:uncharacterized protein DSM5745_06484 [Aspergillus mulundensis]|uniref:Uncharacterized protein n=1 Tax=Aspergillus mulundensis TaxID=1810919 RepID=A0A3D8RQY1_9EURO|nr:Uncharacterized protein DSM5745_06484 [Aspergillus mulundensis]RDW76492.1 Uncharacterized protein DSM5745_06484 [Aspergillus mulundensis]